MTSLTPYGESEIHMSVTMHAEQTKSGNTTASGTRNYVLYRAPINKKIVKIVKPTEEFKQEHAFTDAGYKKTYVKFGSDAPIRKYMITGDTKGKESGWKTRVKLMFNPITLELGNRTLEPGEKYVETAAQEIDIPLEHTKGNGNFSSHNMRVAMTARVFLDGKRVRCELTFKAREERKDWTTVEGTKTITLYTAPAGKKILGIPGIVYNKYENYLPKENIGVALLEPISATLWNYSESRATIAYPFEEGPASVFNIELHPSGTKGAQRTKASVNLRAIQVRIADSQTLQPSSGGPTGTGSAPVQHGGSAPAPSGSSSPFPGH